MNKGSFWALLPLILFVVIYFAGSYILGDFYALPVLVVFVIALFVAFFQFPKKNFNEKLASFAKGSGDENILIMILIFLLAGAFGELSKNIGAISSTINFALTYIPPQFVIAGLFLVSCFISTSLGTSVGTIVALAPIAVGLEENITGIMPIALAAVIGGSMFGDNLSFISDTTIAATRTQNVAMKEKFRVNFKLVLPVAIIVMIIYGLQGFNMLNNAHDMQIGDYELIKILPYIIVFILALSGLSVIWTLGVGILSAAIIGISTGSIDFLSILKSINDGFAGMFELSILCLIIGGVVGIIRMNGGIDYLLHVVTKKINSKKRAELSIAFLVSLVNLAIANNTITIVIVGPIAKDISDENGLNGGRVASILDTISCFIQGLVPYGAQILAALAAANVVLSEEGKTLLSPIDIMQYLYYPVLMGLVAFLFIIFRKDKKEAQLT
ncbi:Na+/H+ antiporter NhaC family protein [Sphingobacterium daejeonense]|uniref:Na+/H+ antiporter NhaC family protein n=1 Tax=Sphingobacterium daejeonense TaxID=371142 RepID=UPI0021A7CDEE|nr:Na+/H+ antiporter NhaC family protein [Sphingobacterium daejeonense]MCT1532217.1 Na+/H+ antiporter NhaC family protein [Sphingobacterium daejeonense]